MGRRKKWRVIAHTPNVTVFKPAGVPAAELSGVVLELDQLEAMRLVDAEGLSLEDAAARMEVSAPTLSRILAEGRAQVARALTQGWAIRIETDTPHAQVSQTPNPAPEGARRIAMPGRGQQERGQGGRGGCGRGQRGGYGQGAAAGNGTPRRRRDGSCRNGKAQATAPTNVDSRTTDE